MSWHFPFAGQLGVQSAQEPQFLHSAGSPDPLRQIAYLHELGFAGITDNRIKHRPPEVQARMGEELARRGMRMGTFTHATALPGQPRALPFTRRDAQSRALLRQEMESSIEVARRMGGGIALVTSLSEPGRSVQAQTDDFAANLEDLLPRVEGAGLRIGLEGVSPQRLAGLLMARSTEALALADRIGSPAVGVVFDSYHVGTQEGDLAAAFRHAARRVLALQLSDVPDRIAPGLGTLDLVSLLREVRACGQADMLLEMEFFPTEKSARAEAEALAGLRRLDEQAAGAALSSGT